MTEVMVKACLFFDELRFWAPSNHESTSKLLLTLNHLRTLLHAETLAHIFFVLPCRRIPANFTAATLLSEEGRACTVTSEAVSWDLATTTVKVTQREIYLSHYGSLALLRGQMHLLLIFLLMVHTWEFCAPSHRRQRVDQTCHMLLDIEGDVWML